MNCYQPTHLTAFFHAVYEFYISIREDNIVAANTAYLSMLSHAKAMDIMLPDRDYIHPRQLIRLVSISHEVEIDSPIWYEGAILDG